MVPPSRWAQSQVLALAPDASSVAAARRLAVPAPWAAAGAASEAASEADGGRTGAGNVVWGECRGSGRTPYRTAVDLTGPAFSCSCPSRKFPCKHALALLLRWAADPSGSVVPDGSPPDWVTGWLAERAARADRSAARARSQAAGQDGAPVPAADPQAVQARAERRERRMLDGLRDLDQWLHDQVRSGLAGTERAGYQPFDGLAARLVDAQLPAVASVVRQLAATAVSGDGWPGRLLEEYALLHLLARSAAGALAGDDVDLAATVRARLGVNIAKDDVLASPGRRDRWAVLALRDELEDRLTVRRVWLRGEGSRRIALVLSFAPPGQPLDTSLVPGTTVDAELHDYPGAVRLRALVGARHATVRTVDGVPGVGLGRALEEWSQALAGDPWTRSWPVVVAGVVPVLDAGRWWLLDDECSLPLVGVGDEGWEYLALSGGYPLTMLVEVVPGGVRGIEVIPSVAARSERAGAAS